MSAAGDTESGPSTLAACGLIVAAVGAAYCNCLGYPFLFDGIPLAAGLRTLSLADPAGWLQLRPRIAGYLTFDLQHTVHGMWLPGFHLVNIAIHAAAACLLFLIVRGVTAARLGPARAGAAGLFTALLWGLHPLQTHCVTYLYQRFESLMGLLFLAGLYCLWRAAAGRAWSWLAASYGCVLLSIATKEVGITALPVFLLFDRAFLAASWREVRGRRGWYYGGLLATVGAGVAYVLLNRDHYLAGGLLCAQRVSTWQYFRTQPEIIGHYLLQACWPSGLCVDPSWPVEDDAAWLVVAWGLVAATAATTAWLWRRDPQLGFLPLAFALVLAPTSSVAPTIDLAFEHRMYLSLACVAAAVVVAVLGWCSDRRLAAAVLGAAAVSLGGAAFLRNAVHASPLTLWGDTATKAPHSTKAWANLGTALEEAGDAESAARCYAEIVALYLGAAGRAPHPHADVARRVPRTIEYVWYGYVRLANLALDAGDPDSARQFYDEITRLPALPQGGLEEPQLKDLSKCLGR
jgi:tetratricopeptide (TPR) repeat protein